MVGSRGHLFVPFGYRKIQVAESCQRWRCSECKSNFLSNMNHIIHVFAETPYHGELTNLKCLHRSSTLKRGEGSFVALLEKWESLRFRKRSINSPMRNFFLKVETTKQFQRKWKNRSPFRYCHKLNKWQEFSQIPKPHVNMLERCQKKNKTKQTRRVKKHVCSM